MQEVFDDEELTPTQKFGLNLFQLVDGLGTILSLFIPWNRVTYCSVIQLPIVFTLFYRTKTLFTEGNVLRGKSS